MRVGRGGLGNGARATRVAPSNPGEPLVKAAPNRRRKSGLFRMGERVYSDSLLAMFAMGCISTYDRSGFSRMNKTGISKVELLNGQVYCPLPEDTKMVSNKGNNVGCN
jgi:hypothetical protein